MGLPQPYGTVMGARTTVKTQIWTQLGESGLPVMYVMGSFDVASQKHTEPLVQPLEAPQTILDNQADSDRQIQVKFRKTKA